MSANCPSPDLHGNPFRYCPNCSWIEETPAVNNPDQYLDKAKRLAAGIARLRVEDVYVVWFCKTLGNWKALVSTDVISGAYWEVTYNGAKKETYVDAYVKAANTAIPDA